MKKIFNHNFIMLLLLSVATFTIAACNKANVNTTTDLSTPREFKPGGLTVAAGQTSAKVSWTASLLSTGQKLNYTAQFSRDTAFGTVDFTLNSDSLSVTAADDKLSVRVKYWVRVKANANVSNGQAESKWIESSKFSISGTQLFQTIRETEIKETSVTLRFTPTVGLSKITMTPTAAGGTAFDVALSAADAAAGIKVITGLTPATAYSAELFDTKSKGYVTFTTLSLTVYTTTLTAGADIAAAIAAAPNNAIIGLSPGTYNAGSALYPVLQKTVTLKSTSGNPSDTKVNFKEFTLRGTGAGINFSGIELDGTTPAAAYFVNCTGVAADAEQCVYTQVTVDNCIVHGVTTSFLRANRGAAAGDYKMTLISVKNSVVYDIGSLLTYSCFHLDKLQFNALTVTKSTFYNFGMQLLTCATTISASAPIITFDQDTFNNFGAVSKNAVFNASANPVNFTMNNSILANIPRTGGTVAAALTAATAASTTITFANNNLFNYLTTAGGAVLTLPATAANNRNEVLNWTANTTDFTLPAGSPSRTSSLTGGAIGDPRWAY